MKIKVKILIMLLTFISFKFSQAQTVTVVNGTILPSLTTINYGDTQRYTYSPKSPADGYFLDSLIVDGLLIPKNAVTGIYGEHHSTGHTLRNITPASSLRVVYKLKAFGINQTVRLKRPNLPDSVKVTQIGNQFTPATLIAKKQITLPITWDDTAGYVYTTSDFGNVVTTDTIDGTNRYKKVVKPVGAASWAGTTLGTGDQTPTKGAFLPGYPNTTSVPIISVKVWVPQGIVVALKLEDAANGKRSVETSDTAKVGGWQTLRFNFNNPSTPNTWNSNFTYNKVIIYFDLGTDGAAGKVFYFDSVYQSGSTTIQATPNIPISLPITWDDPNVDYTVSNFGGAVTSDTAIATNRYKKILKPAGAASWAGTTLGNDAANRGAFSNGYINSTTIPIISVKLWAPQSTKILLKFEDAADGGRNVELAETTTVSGWQTVRFNFSNANWSSTTTYNKIIIFFDFGNDGAAGKVFYLDSVWQSGDVRPFVTTKKQITLPITWDDTAGYDYTVTSFNGAVTTDTAVGANLFKKTTKPLVGGGNAGVTLGNELYGHTTRGAFLPAFVNSVSKPIISVKLWSPTARTKIRLKIENATDVTRYVEVDDTTTVVGWQTVRFNFNNHVPVTSPWSSTATYNKLSIFFDFGVEGSGKVFLFDSIYHSGSAETVIVPPVATKKQIALPITWDDTTYDYTVTAFEGAVTTDTISGTNKFKKTTKNLGSPVWAGTTLGNQLLGHTTAGAFLPGYINSTSIPIISVKVWVPTARTRILLKLEDAANGDNNVETHDTTNNEGGWQTVRFDFSKHLGNNSWNSTRTYNKVSIFFNYGTAGTGPGTVYLFDSVWQSGSTTPETPIGSAKTQITLPITWDDTARYDYTVTDFGGAATSDTNIGTNFYKKTIKTVGAAEWAGTTLGLATVSATKGAFLPGFINTSLIPIINIKVWAPSNTRILLKLEDATNNNNYVEVYDTTKVDGWQTVRFNFSKHVTGEPAWSSTRTYNKVSIFFAKSTAGSGQVFYFDSVYISTTPGVGFNEDTRIERLFTNNSNNTLNVDQASSNYFSVAPVSAITPKWNAAQPVKGNSVALPSIYGVGSTTFNLIPANKTKTVNFELSSGVLVIPVANSYNSKQQINC